MRDFEFNAGWQRQLSPRRGSLGVSSFSPVSGARRAVEKALGDDQTELRSALASNELGQAGLVWLDGDPGATPLGAAVVAIKVLDQSRMEARKVPFADVWLAEQGVGFAAQAAVELMALEVEVGPPGRVYELLRGQHRVNWWEGCHLAFLLRVRAALAASGENEYRQVVDDLAEQRVRHEYHRLATSLLAPGEPGWVEECVAATLAAKDDGYRAVALTQALADVGQLERLDDVYEPRWSFRWRATNAHSQLATLVDGIGAEVFATLLTWYDEAHINGERERRLVSLLAQFPTDEAMRSLIGRFERKYVAPALQEALERFPERGVRLLAEAGPAVDAVLRAHILGNRDLAAQVVAEMPAQDGARVQALLAVADQVSVAPESALPLLLVSPPWLNRDKTAKPVVVAGLVCTAESAVHWLEGEQEAFAQLPREFHAYRTDPAQLGDWQAQAARFGDIENNWYDDLAFLLEAPAELARPALAGYAPDHWVGREELAPVVARYGTDAVPAMVRRAESNPADVYPLLAPLFSVDLAVKMVEWLARRKSAKAAVTSWLLRHAAAASLVLVPQALGKTGLARRQAEAGLLLLSARGEAAAVQAAAESYGPQALEAIGDLLARDPLTVLPARIPANPAWAAPGLLPSVRLLDSSEVLPAASVEHLVTVFALSRVDQPYAGLDLVKEAVRPEDLAGFVWALFDRWHASGAEPKENWAMDALALAGGDEAARRLTPLILAWPGTGGHQRAVTGVSVLAGIGSDVALMHLHTIAQRTKFKGLKSKAQEKMSEVAQELGLTAEQLADRLVPDLGLDADGTMRLDYGPRQFVVGFDEQLKPFVADSDGRRLKALPKPGAKDNPELAPAAFQQFSALKKDTRRVAADVMHRLEAAMVNGRRWSGTEFRELFVGHPLLWHIVRRLVWGLFDEQGRLTGTLRVAEDRTFADPDDEEVLVADESVVGVVHPLLLGEAGVARWAEVFVDYEILQPFQQLSRPVHALAAQDAADGNLKRFEGLSVPSGRLLGLERHGWRRDSPMDGGVQVAIEVSFGTGLRCSISLDPGFVVGLPTEFEDQRLEAVTLDNGSYPFRLREADAVAVSEIVRDLTDVTEEK